VFAAAAKRTVPTAVAVAFLIVASIAGAAAGGRDKQAPSAPTNLRATSAGSSEIGVAWNAAQDDVGVTGYNVHANGQRVSVDETSHRITGLSCGWSGDVGVSAFDAAGNESPRTTATMSTAACVDRVRPSTPTGFRQVATTRDAVVLAWEPSTDDTGVVGYGVYRDLTLVASSPEPNVTVSGLACGKTYVLSVDAVDAAGNRSAFGVAYVTTSPCETAPAPIAPPAPSTCPTGQFRGEYFANATLTGSPARAVCEPKVDFDWALNGPGAPLPSDKFSVRWSGQFDFAAGETTFTVTTDDGVRLWLDGTMIVDVWNDQAASTYKVTRTLAAGKHNLKMEYYDNIGRAVARLGWTTAATPPPGPVPPAPSTCPSGQFRGEYFGNTTLSGSPARVACETRVDFDWAHSGPGTPVPSDKFSARWSGQFDFAAGATAFTVTADDGVRLWLDGAILVDAWTDQAATTYKVTRTLAAGKHDLRMEFYENVGRARALLSWEAAATPPAPVPPAPSSCPTGQLRGQYFANATLTGSPARTVCERIDFNWAHSGPGAPVPTDKFSARWSGQVDFAAGETTFTVTGDDGVRLWLDGTMIVDAWSDQAESTYKVTRMLAAGRHDLKMEYYENIGRAVARLSWTTAANAPPTPAPPAPPAPPPTAPDTTPPTEPENLVVAGSGRAQVSLRWSPSQDDRGVTSYGTYVGESLKATTTIASSTVFNLECGTAYVFETDAADAAGNRSTKAAVIGSTTACVDLQPPTAPTNVVATSRTATSIALGWTAATDNTAVAGYGLYRGGTRVGTSGTTTGIFSGLTCDTNYTLAVDAHDEAGNRSTQTVVMVSTAACPDTSAPTAPTGLTAANMTQTGLSLRWTASTDTVGVTGYDVFRNGTKVATVAVTSVDQSGLACGTSYSFGVVALDAAGNRSPQASLQVSTAACSAPPPPSAWTGPITITRGGTYSGSWESTSSAPAIRVTTSEPVTITGRVRNLAGGDLIEVAFSAQGNVTVDHVFGYGGNGRFLEAENFKSVTVRNCTIDKTSGIKLAVPAAGASVLITRNKHRNIQRGSSSYGNFVQFAEVQTATVDVSWNEIVNDYNQSEPEDLVSIFKSAHIRLHDNYFQGQYSPNNTSSSSQNGITIEHGRGGGLTSHENVVWRNQLVDTLGGIGVFAGDRNRVYDNRVVQDGRLPDGVRLRAGTRGLSIHSGIANEAYGNVVGFVNRHGRRGDMWFPADPSQYVRNTRLPGKVRRATETAELRAWNTKLIAHRIRIGA
jgi:chitodextrinase